MGILAGLRGRRESVQTYRTVDGGNPAPYPDMTDEQLYNYEVTFNVPKRTFAHAPRREQRQAVPTRQAPTFEPPAARQTMNGAQPRKESAAPRAEGERLRRNKAFDAPRYTARKAPPSADAVETASAGSSRTDGNAQQLDLNKPVRLITTKQPVDIITTRARHPVYKVHAYIGDDDIVTVFTLDGRLSENGPFFLENAPTVQQLHLNLYPNPSGDSGARYRITQHDTRAQADAAAEPGRLLCIPVQFDA